MAVSKDLITYIMDHRRLLTSGDLMPLYNGWPIERREELTSLLISAGIDPLIHLSTVPVNYLLGYVGPTLTVDIPKSISVIEHDAFCSCDHISSVTLHDGIKTIDSSAFAYMSSLTFIKIPESLTLIPYEFCRSSGIRDIGWGVRGNLRTIGGMAFNNCGYIRSIVIPEGVEEIYDYAFYNCVGIETVVLPKSIKELGNFIFANDIHLKTVYYSGTVNELDNVSFSEGVFRKCGMQNHGIICKDGVYDDFSI